MARGTLLTACVLAATLVPSAAPAMGDPRRPDQVWLEELAVPEAWRGSRGQGVRIALFDTSGVDRDHEDLVGAIAPGFDGWEGDDVVQPNGGHGTSVAGIMAARADNGRGIVGVAPESTVMPFRPLRPDEAVFRAIELGADVMVFPFFSLPPYAGFVGREYPTTIVDQWSDALRYAWDHGVFLVASAGNQSLPVCNYPASVEEVVCVGAVTHDDDDNPEALRNEAFWPKASYSNFGFRLDLMAPGESVAPTFDAEHASHNRYDEAFSGTSASAPFVAGVAALLMSAGATNVQALEVLTCTATDLGLEGRDPIFGNGLIHAGRAMDAWMNGGCPN